MKFVALCLLALCVTFSVEGKSYKFEENIDTRNAVIDKILEELIKVKNEAKEFLHDAEGKAKEAITKAVEDFNILKAKVQDAAAKGKEISQELIAKAKAEILEDYRKVKPIIEALKAQAKSKLEDIIKKIKESDAVAEIKTFADKVKAYITNFIDNIPDYEEALKEKFEEVKAVVIEDAEIVKDKFEEVKAIVIEEAKIVKEKLVKVEHEARQKLEGLILVAEKILKEQVEPKIKSEVDVIIAIAKVKLQVAQDAVDAVAAKIGEKIEALLEKIDDKTHGVADELIKKYEAKLRALIAEADEKISSLKDKASKLMDEIKSKIDDFLGKSMGSKYGPGSDALVEKIMNLIEKPLSKLPDSIRSIASSAIEHALRFGLKFGKTFMVKLLDFVGDKFGDSVKPLLDMVKMALQMAYKRGAALEGNTNTRNAVIDKILAELIKVKNEAKEVLHEAEGKALEAVAKALDKFNILKAKVQDAAAKGKDISQELIAKTKAEILEDYRKVKPIIEALKAQAKSKLEDIVQKIKESDAVAEIKAFADKVKTFITNFIDHIPDYEQTLKEKFEEVKAVVIEEAEIVKEKFEEVKAIVIGKAKIVKEKLVKVEHEAQHKLEGLIIVVEKILKEKVAPKVKSEVDALIALAKVKLQAAGDFTNLVVEKAEEKIDSILEKIDAKTQGVADELIKKYEAKLRALIAGAEDSVSLLKNKASELMDQIKSKIDDLLDQHVFHSVDTRAAGIDFAVEKIMKALKKPMTKLPENVREWLTVMVEEAVRFAMEHGKTGAKILLDLIAEKAGGDVKPVIEIIKITLDQYV